MRLLCAVFLAPFLACIPMGTHADALASGPDHAHEGIQTITRKVVRVWIAPCDIKGGRDTSVTIKFIIGSDGLLKSEPEWEAPFRGKTWQAAAERATAAIKKAQPYENLPDIMYNRPIKILFDARKACQGV